MAAPKMRGDDHQSPGNEGTDSQKAQGDHNGRAYLCALRQSQWPKENGQAPPTQKCEQSRVDAPENHSPQRRLQAPSSQSNAIGPGRKSKDAKQKQCLYDQDDEFTSVNGEWKCLGRAVGQERAKGS